MKHITIENYIKMKERVKILDDIEDELGCSNFIRFISFIESEDVDWIRDINDILEL